MSKSVNSWEETIKVCKLVNPSSFREPTRTLSFHFLLMFSLLISSMVISFLFLPLFSGLLFLWHVPLIGYFSFMYSCAFMFTIFLLNYAIICKFKIVFTTTTLTIKSIYIQLGMIDLSGYAS